MKSTASEIVKVKKKVRRQEWEQQIEEQKTSGLSVQEWCRQNGIAAKTFYYHLRKVREDFLKSGRSESDRVQNKTELAVVPILTAPVVGNITIEKNGLRIILPENISAAVLVSVLDRLCCVILPTGTRYVL